MQPLAPAADRAPPRGEPSVERDPRAAPSAELARRRQRYARSSSTAKWQYLAFDLGSLRCRRVDAPDRFGRANTLPVPPKESRARQCLGDREKAMQTLAELALRDREAHPDWTATRVHACPRNVPAESFGTHPEAAPCTAPSLQHAPGLNPMDPRQGLRYRAGRGSPRVQKRFLGEEQRCHAARERTRIVQDGCSLDKEQPAIEAELLRAQARAR